VSLDDLISSGEQRSRDDRPDSLRRLEIDNQVRTLPIKSGNYDWRNRAVASFLRRSK
jgi:hypothetical protein